MSKITQTRLKETLEIFFEELEKVEGQMSKLDSRIQMLLEHRPELNTESVEKLIDEHQSNLNDAGNYLIRSHTIFSDKVNEEKSGLEDLFVQNQKKLIEINTGKKKKLGNFYLYTAIAFIIALAGVSFGFNKYVDESELRSKNSKLEYHNSSMFEFINDKEQIEEFNEWLDKE